MDFSKELRKEFVNGISESISMEIMGILVGTDTEKLSHTALTLPKRFSKIFQSDLPKELRKKNGRKRFEWSCRLNFQRNFHKSPSKIGPNSFHKGLVLLEFSKELPNDFPRFFQFPKIILRYFARKISKISAMKLVKKFQSKFK